jgi:probable rRNA maturation factor
VPISFYNAGIKYSVQEKPLIRKWIINEIILNSKNPGDISIIICSDDFLLEINRKYLSHDYFTDIITFDYNNGNTISGDIFISLDRVKENSVEMDVEFSMELKRVIIHGLLHLLGEQDNTPEDKSRMHNLEDACIQRFPTSLKK